MGEVLSFFIAVLEKENIVFISLRVHEELINTNVFPKIGHLGFI